MTKQYIYGIDFGTTNSTLAILDTQTNEVVKLFTTPSLLFFPENEENVLPFIGETAIENYLENGMNGRFMKSVKRVLPNNGFKDTLINNKRFTAEELVALIMGHLTQQADNFLGEKVTTAILGRPVVFDEVPERDALAEERLGKAAKLIGLENVLFQMEPIGAAFAYERQLKQAELVLVADFGGGTSDFTLMKLSPDFVQKPNRKEDMIAQGGIYIGGDNFDASIMWEKGTPHFGKGLEYQSSPGKWLPLPSSFFFNICSWEKMNFFDSQKIKNEVRAYYNLSGKKPQLKNLMSLIDCNLGYKMTQSIEKTKVELSTSPQSTFTFHEAEIDFEDIISLQTFEQKIIQKDLRKIDNYLSLFLEKQGIGDNEIDAVFMTGGSSMVQPLRNLFLQRFGQEKIKSGDNFNSVAIGLAYSYPLFER